MEISGGASSCLVDRLKARFSQVYGRSPQVLVRAPGRINLIGEHTDYSLLPVLPLAIDRATYLAMAAVDSAEVMASSQQFAGSARLNPQDPQAGMTAPWHGYLAGVLLRLQDQAPAQGAALLLDGDLPCTGGLSSSSSLTMGLLAGFNALWDLDLDRRALVEHGILAERHVGVESGGMDQTVIGLAEAGAALRVDFSPPSTRAVPLPPALRMVAAYSGAEAPKGGAVREAYNQRVVGCRLAAALLAQDLGLDTGGPPVLGAVSGHAGALLRIEDLPRLITPAEVAASTGVILERLVGLTAGPFNPQTPVMVRAAARHVLGEARRVDRAQRALEAGDLEGLGALLDQSHRSLAQDFRCSTAALDRLCQAMREAGALGARLTGAGFGGYAIAVCLAEDVPRIVHAAQEATGGPAMEVQASAGLSVTWL